MQAKRKIAYLYRLNVQRCRSGLHRCLSIGLAMLCGVFILLLPTWSAASITGATFGLSAGASLPSNTALKDACSVPEWAHHMKTGYDLSADVGYRLIPLLLLQGSFDYLRNPIQTKNPHAGLESNTHSSQYITLVSAILHVPSIILFSPYVGAGVGVGNIRFANNVILPKSTGFAFQGTLGVVYAMFPGIGLKVGYRMLGLTFKGSSGAKDAVLLNNIITAGLSYNF